MSGRNQRNYSEPVESGVSRSFCQGEIGFLVVCLMSPYSYNGIIGMTEIALKDGQTEERRIDCLKKSSTPRNICLGLSTIFWICQDQSGKMRLIEEKCNLMEMIQGLRPLLRQLNENNIQYMNIS
ncbi:MAG: hypothetical protein ACLRMZ_11055 [Blautia marasmi]